jgi:molybdopterin synthase catalytic subunit
VSDAVAEPRIHVDVVRAPLSLEHVAQLVRDPRAGAVVVFSGETRTVAELLYDGYVEMARVKMMDIARSVLAEHELCAAAAVHRLGRVPRSESSVAVAASAPHRDAAFLGARAIIDRIKDEVPIWKQQEGDWKYEALPSPPGNR